MAGTFRKSWTIRETQLAQHHDAERANWVSSDPPRTAQVTNDSLLFNGNPMLQCSSKNLLASFIPCLKKSRNSLVDGDLSLLKGKVISVFQRHPISSSAKWMLTTDHGTRTRHNALVSRRQIQDYFDLGLDVIVAWVSFGIAYVPRAARRLIRSVGS